MIQTILKSPQSMVLRVGLTVWRPVFRGQIWNPVVVESRSGGSSLVKVKYYSRTCYIDEPSVNHFNLTGHKPNGITCFLLDVAGKPTKELPYNWFGLEVVSVDTSLRFVHAKPLICPDILEYLEFRHEIACKYGDKPACMAVKYPRFPNLPRVYVDERIVGPTIVNYEYEYFQ